ncbi:YiiX family permuted papain-like enzyme [candidate division GN15 bacterium]|nr:YiiX family permuted papain-like enzyme [candidate division GN15 bacterium]
MPDCQLGLGLRRHRLRQPGDDMEAPVMRTLSGKLFIVAIMSVVLASACGSETQPDLRVGDIVFQNLTSSQSSAIRLATNSEWSHCGVVITRDSVLMVAEAVQPIRIIPLEQWLAQGVDSAYLAMRLSDRDSLASEDQRELAGFCEDQVGKRYDPFFGWSDDRLYCSELVWKAYREALDFEIAPLRKLSEYDFSHPVVQAKLRQRYGSKIPLDELVVSPGDIEQSTHLHTVHRGP